MDSSHGRHGRQKQQRKVEKRSRSNSATAESAAHMVLDGGCAASATLASARGQKRALYYRLYPVTQPFWALKKMWKNPFMFEYFYV